MPEGRKGTRPPEPAPVAFTLDGHRLVLGHRPARWWLRTLASEPPGCWWQAVPMALEHGGLDHVVGRLTDEGDAFDLDDAERLAEQVVGAVAGMDFWAAHRLAASVWGNWIHFDGWAATNGFDPLCAPVGRVLSAAYAWRMGMCEKKSEAQKVDGEVWGPPPMKTAAGRLRDQAPVGWDDDRESAAFMDALAVSRG